MSYKDGMAAIQLELPARIPHTEYSVESHWAVVSWVTGIDVDENSPADVQRAASLAFRKTWNYDFQWATQIGRDDLGDCYTEMGHAVYAAGGVDYVEVGQSPFQNIAEILNFDPEERLPNRSHVEIVQTFNQQFARSRAIMPDCVHTLGTYITLISGFIYLFGWNDLLLAMGEDRAAFGEMTRRYADWMMKYYTALAETDSPVILIHDDIVWSSGPFVSPRWYRQHVFPQYERYLEPLKAAGKKVLFCSDGNFDAFVDDLAAVGMDGFIFEPMTSLENIVEKYGQSHVIIGNADTRILLSGTKDEIRKETERCMFLGRDCPGFFMAVGNHIPSNTPVENVLYYNQLYQELSIQLRK
jgi:hypothetical protein